MTPIHRAVSVLALLLAVPAEAHAFKCMAPLQKDPIVVIDGVAAMPGAMKELDSLDVHSIEIACWNAADSTFSQGPGYGVVLVVTKAAMKRATSLLEEISRAQAGFYGAEGRFAGSMAELSLGESALAAETRLEPDGWGATVWLEARAERCHAYGTADDGDATLAARGYPTCALERSKRFVIADEVLEAHRR